MKSSFRVLASDVHDVIPDYDSEDVRKVLERAASDPVAVQDLRLSLARSSPGLQTFRLSDREVIRQVEALVLDGSAVLAPAQTADPPASSLKTYKGKKFSEPVKLVGGKWVAVWPISATPTEGELGEVGSTLDRNTASTKATTVFEGPTVAQEMITKLNEMEDDKKSTAEAQKEQEQALVEAERKRDDAKKNLEAAQTPSEKREAQAVLEMAEEQVKMHQHNIDTYRNHIKELNEKGPRAVRTLRLHEQTHVDITAEVAEHVNKLLKSEADPAKRDTLIDQGIKIAEVVNQEMDKKLNPGTFGSVEDETALKDWISDSALPNYHASIDAHFAALT